MLDVCLFRVAAVWGGGGGECSWAQVWEDGVVLWEQSTQTDKIDPNMNNACRVITGCLKPTNVNNVYLLTVIAPPAKRRGTIESND